MLLLAVVSLYIEETAGPEDPGPLTAREPMDGTAAAVKRHATMATVPKACAWHFGWYRKAGAWVTRRWRSSFVLSGPNV